MSTAPDVPVPGAESASATDRGNGLDPAGTAPGAPEGGAPETNEKSLAEARKHASLLQSRLDRALPWAELAKHPRLAGANPNAVIEFIEKMIPLTQRPDFAAYQSGQRATPEDDEMLTDEQRELHDLRQKLTQLEARGSTQDQALQRSLVEARFERAEKEVEQLLGPAWAERREPVLDQITGLARYGGDASNVTPMLLLKAYWNSFEDPESLFEAMTHHVGRREQARLDTQRSRETTVPGNIVPGGVPPKAPKSFADAWALGQQDVRRSA